MELVVTQQVDGTLKLYWMQTVELNAKNGGWVQGKQLGGQTLGVPVGQVKAVEHVPEP